MSRDIICDSKGCSLESPRPHMASGKPTLYGSGGSGNFGGPSDAFSNYIVPLYNNNSGAGVHTPIQSHRQPSPESFDLSDNEEVETKQRRRKVSPQSKKKYMAGKGAAIAKQRTKVTTSKKIKEKNTINKTKLNKNRQNKKCPLCNK
jgi:hypothetical protein